MFGLFARLKKQVMKEAVEYYVNVMTSSHMMGSWLVFHSFIYSVFQRFSKLDIEHVIITVGTVKIKS
jgi:predicted transcriptional regulator